MHHDIFNSPIGELHIYMQDEFLCCLTFRTLAIASESPSKHTQAVKSQLEAYFKGELQQFDMALKPEGTDFQRSVWNKLSEIPYGTTTNYLEIAQRLGNEKSIRAAASANGKNPIAIIIPCHRVIGKNGSLIGYSGELWRKDWLLKHEAKVSGKLQQLF